MARGDFERWLLQVVGCRELAIEISKLRGIGDAELLRRKLLDAIERKIEELKREDG